MRALEAMAWALKGNHLKVYPKPTKSTYTHKVGKQTRTMYYVKLVIQIGNAHHEGTEQYKQHEISEKVEQIYLHYYNNRTIKN